MSPWDPVCSRVSHHHHHHYYYHHHHIYPVECLPGTESAARSHIIITITIIIIIIIFTLLNVSLGPSLQPGLTSSSPSLLLSSSSSPEVGLLVELPPLVQRVAPLYRGFKRQTEIMSGYEDITGLN